MEVPTPEEISARVAEIFFHASLLNGSGKPSTTALEGVLARKLLANGEIDEAEVEAKAIRINALLSDVFDDLIFPHEKGYTMLEEAAYKRVSARVTRALQIRKDGSGPVQALINAENHKNGASAEGVTLLHRMVTNSKGTGRVWGYYVSKDPTCIELDAIDLMLDRQRLAQEDAANCTNYYGEVQPANAPRFSAKTRQALEEGVKQAQGLLNV